MNPSVSTSEKPDLDNQSQETWNEMKDESNSSEMMAADEDMSPTDLSSARDSSELPSDMTEWSPAEVAAYTALRSKRKKCCVGGCTHRSLPLARSYHQLPVRNKEIWVKWIEVIRWSRNEPDWSPNGDAAPLVCSRHFPDSDFISYEASSRVRLSHTAIPIYFVDPPEGTVMDGRFNSPLPIPPMLPGSRQKDSPKSKNVTLNDQSDLTNDRVIIKGQKMKHATSAPKLPKYTVNFEDARYDDEEMTEQIRDNDEDACMEQFLDKTANISQYAFASINAVLASKGIGRNREADGCHIQTSNPGLPKSRNLKYASSASKPPGLIRANFTPFKDNFQANSVRPLPRGISNLSSLSSNKLALPVATVMKQMPPTKHRIGLAKCRLIVQTLEDQMKMAKMHLAEQLELPYQVVNGVWNMRDSLKDKL